MGCSGAGGVTGASGAPGDSAGRSGSGKSTLLRALVGLEAIDRGSVELAGERVDELSRAAAADLRRRTVASVGQASGLTQFLSATENVMLALAVRGVAEAEAERQTIAFLERFVGKGRSPMCGNSICQDRRFLARTMPALEAFFHYRNLDVSSVKELARRWRPDLMAGFRKQQAHTALADIHESIDELRYWREHFLKV